MKRRAFGPHDGRDEFEYCGMRYSDSHPVRGDGAHPLASGHEIAGVIGQVGSERGGAAGLGGASRVRQAVGLWLFG